MIETKFWEDVRDRWIVAIPPKVSTVINNSGQTTDLWEQEEEMAFSFDDLDFGASVASMLNGGDVIVKGGMASVPLKTQQQSPEPQIPVEMPKPKRPKLDEAAFDDCLAKRTLSSFAAACQLLMKCELPKDMNDLYEELVERLPVLQDAIDKFVDVYHADVDEFYDYFIPEALELTATYLEYLDLQVGDEVIEETKTDVMNAVDKLLVGVNDKIEEIYRFASIEIKAKAKALEALMNQDGHIDPDFRL